MDEFTAIDVSQAMGHAWDEEGNLYVASMGAQKILKFGVDGAFLGDFALAPAGMRPANIWFDDELLYVIDWENGHIKTFDAESGAYEGIFAGGLVRVEGYGWEPSGGLLLCDWELGQVVRYSSGGTRIGVVVEDDELRNPNSILVREVVLAEEDSTGS